MKKTSEILSATILKNRVSNVYPQTDGDGALEKLNKNPDLIILDIMMPEKDGYEVCKIIRAQGNTVPIIFLTAMDREFDEIKGLECGGDDYLRKPFSQGF